MIHAGQVQNAVQHQNPQLPMRVRAAVTARITTITTLSAARAAAEGIAALQRGEVRVQALQHLHAERISGKRR